ncbi:MAG: hypothetical protein KVP17_004379 [Porospora cf. gigantea B]|uniref:uncharacterized protein n=1 Tax=Porospora cf. gigantea B TaxID=2853592 RepID=UPI003571A65A|nr:MAG: hypothetical protein KVP17_004379 [Porospora cf. gigantea B]
MCSILPSIQFVSRVDDKVLVHGDLGQGYTSTVHRVFDRETLQECAMKVVSKKKLRSIARDSYYKDVLSQFLRLSHPNIVRIYRVYETFDAFYVLMEVCEGPDLVDFCLSNPPGKLPMDLVKLFFHQLLTGLCAIHMSKMIHRDVKLDNIMLHDQRRRVKIIDVDMSMFTNRTDGPHGRWDTQAVVGTREYMAPECHLANYSRRSDLWACGVVLFIMVDGHFPFNTKGEKEEVRRRLTRPLTLSPVKVAKQPEVWNLICSLLRQPNSRCLFSAHDGLAHPWLQQKIPSWPSPATTTASPEEDEWLHADQLVTTPNSLDPSCPAWIVQEDPILRRPRIAVPIQQQFPTTPAVEAAAFVRGDPLPSPAQAPISAHGRLHVRRNIPWRKH